MKTAKNALFCFLVFAAAFAMVILSGCPNPAGGGGGDPTPNPPGGKTEVSRTPATWFNDVVITYSDNSTLTVENSAIGADWEVDFTAGWSDPSSKVRSTSYLGFGYDSATSKLTWNMKPTNPADWSGISGTVGGVDAKFSSVYDGLVARNANGKANYSSLVNYKQFFTPVSGGYFDGYKSLPQYYGIKLVGNDLYFGNSLSETFYTSSILDYVFVFIKDDVGDGYVINYTSPIASVNGAVTTDSGESYKVSISQLIVNATGKSLADVNQLMSGSYKIFVVVKNWDGDDLNYNTSDLGIFSYRNVFSITDW